MSENKNYVTYLDFGAVGDGKTDDFEAIVKAHDYANEKGIPVVLCDEKTYYIHENRIDGSPRSAIIKTDVDWGESKFIIDDIDITGLDGTNRHHEPIFRIESEYEKKTVTDPDTLAAIGAIGEGTKKINLALGYPALLIIYNENERIFKRYGASYIKLGGHNGAVKNEIILVDGEGNIDESTPFMFDYEGLTKIEVVRTDDKPLTVKGGIFTTLASRVDGIDPANGLMADYLLRGLQVIRSNTTLSGIRHYVEGEVSTYEHRDNNLHGGHYYGFYNVRYSNNILIKDCVLTGRRYYRVCGTYEFAAFRVNKISLVGCTQSNFTVKDEDGNTVFSMTPSKVSGTLRHWGVCETDFCKNMEYRDCVLSRFDAHQGLYNGKIINSKINFMELTGKGELYIENLDWYSPNPGNTYNSLAYLRDDYGSTWNGTITFKNCRAHFSGGDGNIFFHHYANWDFGNVSHFPNVIIDNLEVYGIGPEDKLNLKSPSREPAMHRENTSVIARMKPDGTPDPGNMVNANRVVPPEFVKVINCKPDVKIYVEDISFYENTEFEGVIKE